MAFDEAFAPYSFWSVRLELLAEAFAFAPTGDPQPATVQISFVRLWIALGLASIRS